MLTNRKKVVRFNFVRHEAPPYAAVCKRLSGELSRMYFGSGIRNIIQIIHEGNQFFHVLEIVHRF